jgi:formylglycine-generating enzyme required for sulfatase activity
MKTNINKINPMADRFEEDRFRRMLRPLPALLAAVLLPAGAMAQTTPVVTGVTATPAPFPSQNVNVSFTISDSISTGDNIWILASSDGGNTWTVPAATVSGSWGLNVPVTSTPTVMNMVWSAGQDWNGNYTPKCRVRVVACNNGMSMVPAGNYMRGNYLTVSNAFSPQGDPDLSVAPANQVFVNAFLMDNKDVGGYLWTNVTIYAASHGYKLDGGESWIAAGYPVTGMNWYDAVKWCNARSELEGIPPVYYTNDNGSVAGVYRFGDVDAVSMQTGGNGAVVNGYRLPTEAEWEKAARGGQVGLRFPWGNTISESQANYDGNTGGYDLGPTGFNVTYPAVTSPGGAFPSNGYYLYDMAGDVFCWCWDWYSSTYYAAGQSNPQGPGSPTSTRVIRGSSYASSAGVARCAFRPNVSPGSALGTSGFRCVRGF